MDRANGWGGVGQGALARGAGVLACALGLLTALPAVAQMAPPAKGSAPVMPTSADSEDLEDESSGVASLPGYPGRGLSLMATVQTRYDDNLARRPIKDDGVRIRPKATLSYGLGAGRVGLYGIGSYGRDIVRGNNLFRGADRHFYGGGVSAMLSRCNLDAGASFRSNLVFTADVGVVGSIEQRTAQAGGTASCQIGSAISISGGVTHADLRIARQVTGAFDSKRWTYTTGVAFARPALGRISLDGSLSDIDLLGRQVQTPTGPQTDGLLQRSVRLGYQREFGSRLTLSFGGSYLDTAPKNTQNVIIVDGLPQVVDRSSFKGAGYDANLTFRLSPRLSLIGSASRNVRTNGFAGAQFSVVDLAEVAGRYDLPGGLSLTAGYSQRNARFRGAVVSAVESRLRSRDRFSRYFAQLGGNIGRRINFALDVSHNQRRSDPSVFDFNSTAVGLTLGFELGNQGSR
jgi:hypothetical protein